MKVIREPSKDAWGFARQNAQLKEKRDRHSLIKREVSALIESSVENVS